MTIAKCTLPIVFVSISIALLPRPAHSAQPPDDERQPIPAAASPKASAAKAQRPVKLKAGAFLPAGDLEPNLARAKARHPEAKTAHVIVQFDELPAAARRTELEAAGIRLLGYLPENTYFAIVPLHLPKEQLQSAGITWIGGIRVADKIAPSVQERGPAPRSQNADGTVNLWVRYFEDVAPKDAEAALEKLGARILSHVQELQRVTVNLPAKLINDIASADCVRWVQDLPAPPTEHNDASRENTQAEVLQAPPYGLSGAGVVVGEWDGGLVDNAHPDLAGRVIQGESGSVGEHATHVAGTMLGNGSRSVTEGGTDRQWRGMAPAATVVSYKYTGATIWEIFESTITEHKGAIEQYGIVLSQNSWGEDVQPG